MSQRVQHLGAHVRLLRQIGVAKKRRRLPRPVQPNAIRREYTRELLRMVSIIKEAMHPLLIELPQIVASAEIDRRDSFRADAGEGKRIRDLMEQARERMKFAFQKKQIEDLSEKIGVKVTSHAKEQFMRQARAALGVEIFVPDRKLGPLLEGFVSENVSLITGLPDRIVNDVESTITRSVQRGIPHAELAKQLAKRFDIAEDKAKLIARDQVLTLNSQITIARQREIGLERFIWRTVGDDRVRDEHEALEGNVYSYEEGGDPDEGLPGEAINCRCYPEPVFDDVLEAAA